MGDMKLLPIIDFSNLKQDTPAWESVKKQVREALEEYSGFEVTLDDIPLHLQKSVFDGMQQLFDLPLETKLHNTSDKPYHGYVGRHASVPLYESLGIEDVLSPAKVDAFTSLMWPQGNPTFSKSVHCFAEKMHEVEKSVRRMIVEILGLEKYMDEHMESADYVVRVQKYDVPPSHGTEVGLKPHTDKDFVTVLYQNVRGLQIEARNGEWITAGHSPNSFLVIIGDAYHAWTNGRLQSTNHRVMMSGDEARYSIGFFAIPKPGYTVKAPEKMVDEQHPLLFKPYDTYQFLNFLHSNGSRTSSSVDLKAYCGA
ncbi:hypothetical protein ACS0TY_035850 [Phlomoides rotata]